MSIIKWNNQNEKLPVFQNLFDNFLGSDISDYLGNFSGHVPAVNIIEGNDYFRIEVAAPGLSKENFDIKLEKSVLTLTGQKEEKNEDSNERFKRREFSYNSFRRSFHLPETINLNEITANYKDGVLFIYLGKKDEAKEPSSKKIEIK